MNKKLKNLFVGLCAVVLCAPALAADVSQRTDCTDVQARINQLSAIESPSAEQASELSALQAQYRADCSRSASGRRTIASGRVTASNMVAAAATPVAATPVVETVVVTARTILNEYLTERQNLCNELKSDIDKLVANGASDAETEPLQNQYDADCEEIDRSETVEIDEETAARNVSSGLCEDGSKPNKFGCCEGETFTDMGNLVFACCPDDGGACYPPINSGDAI